MEQCPKCKQRYAKRPYKDEQGKPIWKNILLPDWQSALMIVVIIIMLWSYNHDIEQFKDIKNDPYEFCKDYKCQTDDYFDPLNPDDKINWIPDININDEK